MSKKLIDDIIREIEERRWSRNPAELGESFLDRTGIHTAKKFHSPVLKGDSSPKPRQNKRIPINLFVKSKKNKLYLIKEVGDSSVILVPISIREAAEKAEKKEYTFPADFGKTDISEFWDFFVESRSLIDL